jgi:hypothetical protein
MTGDVGARHSRRYRRKLLFLVSAATFFEGYDNFVLSFVLALVLGDLGASEAQAGWVRAISSVPFRVVSVDGASFAGTATLIPGRVVDFERQSALDDFPSEGGPAIADSGTAG